MAFQAIGPGFGRLTVRRYIWRQDFITPSKKPRPGFSVAHHARSADTPKLLSSLPTLAIIALVLSFTESSQPAIWLMTQM